MADNYLEDQYDRYLAKKVAWEKSRKISKKKLQHVSNSLDTPSESKKEFEKRMDEGLEGDE
jgi:hypothetical protein